MGFGAPLVTPCTNACGATVNEENILCNKCDSEMKYYIKKERGKERKLLRCKRKGCQTTQSISLKRGGGINKSDTFNTFLRDMAQVF
ncbi:hypothetical protein QTP88_022665 [Uroleucon formosanum]